MITKTEYEQLVQKSVVLAQQKNRIHKLEEVIERKCERVKELTKIFDQYKYLLKKTAKENEQELSESSEAKQSRKANECLVCITGRIYTSYYVQRNCYE